MLCSMAEDLSTLVLTLKICQYQYFLVDINQIKKILTFIEKQSLLYVGIKYSTNLESKMPNCLKIYFVKICMYKFIALTPGHVFSSFFLKSTTLGIFWQKSISPPMRSNHASRGRCYDHNFLRFLPIFGEKIGVFLKNQCYDNFF
jgi:hypothetical protein